LPLGGVRAVTAEVLRQIAILAQPFTPEGAAKPLEVYPTEEGWGVDIDRVPVCATIKLEQ
jgi:hypothetical protein